VGASYTNYHVRTSDKAACTKALRALIHSRALITEPKNGWITVYDETSESQDIEELRRLGKALSSKLKTAVFCFLVHDSDIFLYLLYERGKSVDQFDSRPDYFGPVSEEHRKEWAGHFERLIKFAPRGTTVAKINEVMEKHQIVEEFRAGDFASLMSIDSGRAQEGFKYAQEASHGYEIIHARGYSTADAGLVEAVAKRDLSTVRALLEKGVSPNQTGRLDEPLLVSAIRFGQVEVAESLVAAGADVFARGGQLGGDSIWIASAEGHAKILELLLSKAKGDERLQRSLDVAFASAVAGGHLEAIRLLLDAGADANKCDEKGNTMLLVACLRGLEGIWELQMKRPFPEQPGRPKTDWPKVVEALLKAGANPNFQTKEGVSALMAAASRGLREVCIVLINSGADPNLKTTTGLTAAAIAKTAGHHSLEALLRTDSE
jgi:ankyrin repeat protein